MCSIRSFQSLSRHKLPKTQCAPSRGSCIGASPQTVQASRPLLPNQRARHMHVVSEGARKAGNSSLLSLALTK
ncbi:hypothetical protein Moror_3963 [Moniliophthora roreri MCA 2997]|uniref:Uncharacterized protein n=1 Tax=Moniliophthora roreri (strain MCA 2997) TaxID=1381753 RepID=V2X7X7_MONRO|nr:hypothetical protein Moror_3963 [Moniliophthora roreri MCA 2997]